MAEPITLGLGALGLYLLDKKTGGGVKKVLLVSGRQRLSEVDARLVQLIQLWEYEGTHNIFIPADGALRAGVEASSHQLQLYMSGTSKARTLLETPHGRGAALDVWPAGYDFAKDVSEQPVMKERLVTFGTFAKRFGFEWGGDWTSPKDYPHVQLHNWRSIPFRGTV